MRAPAPVTVAVRRLDDRLWAIFTKTGPLTDDERELLAAAEAAHAEDYCDDL
jgi:hypothetical protein